MKFAHQYPKGVIIMLFIMLFFIECGVKHPLSVAVSAPEIIETPYKAIQADTAKINTNVTYTPEAQKLLKQATKNAQPSLNVDTLIHRNLELQRVTIMVLDRGHTYRVNNDSLRIAVSEIRKAQIVSDKKADTYYTAAKRSNYYAEQNKNYTSAINYQQWAAFIVILLFLLANTFLLNKIKKHTT